MRFSGAVVVFAVVLAANAFAQETGWVVPDVGTGVIRGRVVAATDGRPLARALLRLTTKSDSWRYVVADEQGAFEFTGLPPRQYELSATLAGYLTLAYGQSTPADAQRPIRLKAGQVRSGMDIALPIGGVITVRVTDESGIPVEGAYVEAQRPQRSADGELRLAPRLDDKQRNFDTDDHGVIRLYDLSPGDYYVSAKPPYILGQPSDPELRQQAGQVQTFHPGVRQLSDAEPVALALGEEINVDIVISSPFTAARTPPDGNDAVASRGGALTVHVTDDAGNPRAGIEVRALAVAHESERRTFTRAKLAATNGQKFWEPREFYTDDHGDVRLYGLPAGDYVVVATPLLGQAMDPDRSDRLLHYPSIYFPGSPSRADAHVLSIQPWDDLFVEIRIHPSRAAHVSGRVVRWDGEPGRAFVVLSRNSAGPLYPQGLVSDSLSRAILVDGEFRFDNLSPGDYVIRTSYEPESDVRDGVAEIAFTVDGADISDLILTTVPDKDRRKQGQTVSR